MLPQPRKIWPWMVTIALIIFVLQAPEAAARLASATVGVLSGAASALGVFVESL